MIKRPAKKKLQCLHPITQRGEGINPIDKHVGKQLKIRRVICGVSQSELAKAVGITFQQLQKYEQGTNRISASRLLQLSSALKTDIGYFFEGIAEKASHSETEENTLWANILSDPEVGTLIRAFAAIKDPLVRKNILTLASLFAGNGSKS